MLEFVISHQFYNYHKIGTLDTLFVYLFVIGTLLHCFTLRLRLDTLHNGPYPVPVITESVPYTGLFISPSGISDRDGQAEGEHINRGRDTPSFCSTLQVLDMCTLGDAADVNPVIKFLRHALQHLAVDSSDCLHDPFSQLW